MLHTIPASHLLSLCSCLRPCQLRGAVTCGHVNLTANLS
jgi:hypothetical protein